MKFLNSTDYPTSQLRSIVTKAIAVARKQLATEINLRRRGRRAYHWRSLGTIAGVEVAYSSKGIYSAKPFGYLHTARFGEQHYLEVRIPKAHNDSVAQYLAAALVGVFQSSNPWLPECTGERAMRMRVSILRSCTWATKLKLQPKESHVRSTRKATKRV